MAEMTADVLARLRERHPVLAEVIDSDRSVAAMRATNVIDLATVLLRRARVQAAAGLYGYQLRGDDSRHA